MASGKIVSLQEYKSEREYHSLSQHGVGRQIQSQHPTMLQTRQQKSAFDYGDFCTGCGTYRRFDRLVELDDGVEAFPVCPSCAAQFELEECDGCGQKVYFRYDSGGSALCGDCLVDDGDFADVDEDDWDE